MPIDTVVYFDNSSVFRLDGTRLIQCERCACLVYDQEASREQHISWHRGWWVGYHEEETTVVTDGFGNVLSKDG